MRESIKQLHEDFNDTLGTDFLTWCNENHIELTEKEIEILSKQFLNQINYCIFVE